MENEAYLPEIEKTIDAFIQAGKLPRSERAALIKQIQERLEQKLSAKRNQKLKNDKEQVKYLIYTLCNDVEDLKLLDESAPYLIQKYQSQTATIIKNQLEKKNFSLNLYFSVYEEVNAALNMKLLRGKLNQFRRDSLFRTFFYMVIKNLVRDELRKVVRKEREVPLNVDISTFTDKKSDIPHQVHHYGKLLKILLPTTERKKFEFCAKVLYRIVLNKQDVQAFHADLSNQQQKEILGDFGKDYALMKKGDLWEKLRNYVQWTNKEEKIGLTNLKTFVNEYKSKILEAVLEHSFAWDQLDRNVKNALDEYFELVVHRFYDENR